MAINVLGFEPALNKDGSVCKFKGGFYPLRISRNKKSAKQVNLLLIENNESEGAVKRHYVLITSISRLMFDSFTHNCGKHYCFHCLRGYESIIITQSCMFILLQFEFISHNVKHNSYFAILTRIQYLSFFMNKWQLRHSRNL